MRRKAGRWRLPRGQYGPGFARQETWRAHNEQSFALSHPAPRSAAAAAEFIAISAVWPDEAACSNASTAGKSASIIVLSPCVALVWRRTARSPASKLLARHKQSISSPISTSPMAATKVPRIALDAPPSASIALHPASFSIALALFESASSIACSESFHEANHRGAVIAIAADGIKLRQHGAAIPDQLCRCGKHLL